MTFRVALCKFSNVAALALRVYTMQVVVEARGTAGLDRATSAAGSVQRAGRRVVGKAGSKGRGGNGRGTRAFLRDAISAM